MEFFAAMNRGQYREERGLEGSSYCIFLAPMEEFCTGDRISAGGEPFVLEFLYGREDLPGALRLRQVESNAVIEESAQGLFRQFLQDKPIKCFSHLMMYAIQFKIHDLSLQIERCKDEVKLMEDELDNVLDNSGTYRLLDYRRTFAECGSQILTLKEILTRIDKGYYSAQMQNGYVLQGETMLQFEFLEERYDLIKNTILKDFDTYTSIVNNNINRSARLLSIISLGAVALNFMLGSVLASSAALGIIGGIVVGGVGIGAASVYRLSRRNNPGLPGGSKKQLAFPAGSRHRKKEDIQELPEEQPLPVEQPPEEPDEVPPHPEQSGEEAASEQQG